jgi:hypothetical protein
MNLPSFNKHDIFTERAEALPAALIGVAVSMFVMVGLGACIGVVMNQRADAQQVDVVQSQINTASTQFTNDIQAATSIDALSDSSLQADMPGENDTCRSVVWNINNGKITRSLTVYAGAINPSQPNAICDTSSTLIVPTVSRTVAENVQASTISYQNRLGRSLTPTTPSSFADSTATAPSNEAQVQAAWNSTDVDAVEMNLVLKVKDEQASRTVQAHKM